MSSCRHRSCISAAQGDLNVVLLMLASNADFIEEMIADPVFAEMLASPEDGHGPHTHTHDPSHSHSHAHEHKSMQAESDLAQDKVRSTLRSFVRDWSVEGADERKQCYDPCLEALERHWKGKERERGDVRVLVPGCGLGRLAMEIAAKGEFVGVADHRLDKSCCREVLLLC